MSARALFRWAAVALVLAAVVLAVLGGVPFAVNFLLPRPLALLAVAVNGVGMAGLAHALWTRAAPGRSARREADH